MGITFFSSWYYCEGSGRECRKKNNNLVDIYGTLPAYQILWWMLGGSGEQSCPQGAPFGSWSLTGFTSLSLMFPFFLLSYFHYHSSGSHHLLSSLFQQLPTQFCLHLAASVLFNLGIQMMPLPCLRSFSDSHWGRLDCGEDWLYGDRYWVHFWAQQRRPQWHNSYVCQRCRQESVAKCHIFGNPCIGQSSVSSTRSSGHWWIKIWPVFFSSLVIFLI